MGPKYRDVERFVTKSLPVQTPEQRAMNLAKALESRKRKSAARASSTLRRDFRDMGQWESMAKAKGVKLPPFGDSPTPTIMRSFLRKLRINVTDYLDWAGETKLVDFALANPTWPARAWAGIVLEWAA